MRRMTGQEIYAVAAVAFCLAMMEYDAYHSAWWYAACEFVFAAFFVRMSAAVERRRERGV